APLVRVTGVIRSLATDGVLERITTDAAQARGLQHGPRLGAAIPVIDQVRVPPGRHEHRGGRNRVLHVLVGRWRGSEGREELRAHTGAAGVSGADGDERTAKPGLVAAVPAQGW